MRKRAIAVAGALLIGSLVGPSGVPPSGLRGL